MALPLYRLENAPRKLPIWESILDDLGRPSAHRIAKTLGVGASTVHRWTATGRAPRVASLALFWLTRWGRSEIDTRAHNDASAAVGLVRALTEERDQLSQHLEALRYEAQARAAPANTPVTAPLSLAATLASLLERREQDQLDAFWRVLGDAKGSHPVCPDRTATVDTIATRSPRSRGLPECVQNPEDRTNWKVSLGPSLLEPRTALVPERAADALGSPSATTSEASALPPGQVADAPGRAVDRPPSRPGRCSQARPGHAARQATGDDQTERAIRPSADSRPRMPFVGKRARNNTAADEATDRCVLEINQRLIPKVKSGSPSHSHSMVNPGEEARA